MTMLHLGDTLRERVDGTSVWLVYDEDLEQPLTRLGTGAALVLRAAFWKRGDAYAFAQRAHGNRAWRHYYVFRLDVDLRWTVSDLARHAELETVFGRGGRVTSIAVTPPEVAGAFG